MRIVKFDVLQTVVGKGGDLNSVHIGELVMARQQGQGISRTAALWDLPAVHWLVPTVTQVV